MYTQVLCLSSSTDCGPPREGLCESWFITNQGHQIIIIIKFNQLSKHLSNKYLVRGIIQGDKQLSVEWRKKKRRKVDEGEGKTGRKEGRKGREGREEGGRKRGRKKGSKEVEH